MPPELLGVIEGCVVRLEMMGAEVCKGADSGRRIFRAPFSRDTSTSQGILRKMRSVQGALSDNAQGSASKTGEVVTCDKWRSTATAATNATGTSRPANNPVKKDDRFK